MTVSDPIQNDQIMDIVERYTLDVWTYASTENEGKILVPPEMRPVFEEEVSNIGVTYRIDSDNIKELVQSQTL